MKKVVIIGAGGMGRGVLELFEHCNQAEQEYDILGFVVESRYGKPGDWVYDKPILGDFDWLERHSKDVYTICAVGASHHRRRLVEMAHKAGARFCSAVHPSVVSCRRVTVGEGVVINAGCLIDCLVHIGNHVIINAATVVGHDSVLEDFVTVSPGVLFAGGVTVGEGTHIGIGAVVIERISIGAWSYVGAGSVINRNVPDNTTVVGVPGRVIKTRPAGWQNEIDEGDLGRE